MMKWTVLSDNRSNNSSLSTEHGLSILLETERHKILLDTGASDVFIQNAELLGVNLSDVDYVFISHGHSDHAGGLRYFLEHNRQAQVIVSPDAMSGMFFSKRGNLHSITTEWPEIDENRLILIDQTCEIAEGIHVMHIFLKTTPCRRAIRTFSLSQMNRMKLASILSWREKVGRNPTSMCRMLMGIISTMISVMNWPCMLMACYSRAVHIADWRTFFQPVLGQFILL